MKDLISNARPGSPRQLQTASGPIEYPAYIPVTTFGNAYPLDELIRPYLPRLAPAIMVSFHYAQSMNKKPRIPVMIDSGGFAALFEDSQIMEDGGLGILRFKSHEGIDELTPQKILDFQEQYADVAFTLDFPIPPGMDRAESEKRMRLTVENAIWALRNRRRNDLCLFASIQGLNANDYLLLTEQLVSHGFDGFAIGGLVPRIRDSKLIETIVTGVLERISGRPLHVFGLGKPEITNWLFSLGVDSVDSSSYVRLAADGKSWSDTSIIGDPTISDRLLLALQNLALASQKTALDQRPKITRQI